MHCHSMGISIYKCLQMCSAVHGDNATFVLTFILTPQYMMTMQHLC